MKDKQLTNEKAKHEFCNDTITLKVDIEKNFLMLGARLYRIREERLHAPFWESFDEYLMEIKIDRSKATRLINIFATYILKYKISEDRLAGAGGWTLLAEPLALIGSKEDAEEWIEKAETLTQSGLRAEIRERKGIPEDGGPVYSIACGMKVRVDTSLESDEITFGDRKYKILPDMSLEEIKS